MEENTTTAVETADNSQEADLDTQISEALDEPAEQDGNDTATESNDPVETQKEDVKDNISQCPDKFKNKDGSVDVEKLSKSYSELEKLRSSEQTKWQEERAELLKAKEQLDNLNKLKEDNAKNAGFNSAQEMQQAYDIVNFEANEYSKYLRYLDDDVRESVRNLLVQYANSPSAELMKEIEFEFSPEINKHVAVQADRMRQAFENERRSNAETRKMTTIESVISQSVDANPEIFRYEPFKKLFVNTLHKYGDTFTFEDAKVLMDTFTSMKGSYKDEFTKEYGIKTANEKATDKLASINNSGSAPASGQTVDIDSLSKSELDKFISKYI